MPTRVAISTLNARSVDIINVIRNNCSAEYRENVPAINDAKSIPLVGEKLSGYPALANEFLTNLINRIAMVLVKSANFNNPYEGLKKGYLSYGETIEEVFVKMAKAREFSYEKGESREFKRTLPQTDVTLHAMNYKAQYPITIEENELNLAFLSADGVTNLISKIVKSLTVAMEYDEFLLFKYQLIKGVNKGLFYPVAVDKTDIHNSAVAFRGTFNKLGFISDKYNAKHVHTNTRKEDVAIFMSADFNASYDVNILASAFNMDKATFQGALHLIDNWTEFDNERFEVIRRECGNMEEVTAEELAIMADVQAIMVDKEFFQHYDNHIRMTSVFVNNAEYWNYFLNVWKTVSYSPYSNAVVFLSDTPEIETALTLPNTINVTVKAKDDTAGAHVVTLEVNDIPGIRDGEPRFIQTDALGNAKIGVHPYGAFIMAEPTGFNFVVDIDGTKYGGNYTYTADVGDVITATKM